MKISRDNMIKYFSLIFFFIAQLYFSVVFANLSSSVPTCTTQGSNCGQWILKQNNETTCSEDCKTNCMAGGYSTTNYQYNVCQMDEDRTTTYYCNCCCYSTQ